MVPGSHPEPPGDADPDAARSEGGWRGAIAGAAERRSVPLATIVTVVGVVVGTGLVLLLLWVLRQELMFVLVATFIALLLSPPVRALERRGLSRSLATAVVFLAGVVVFAGLVFLFGVPLVSAVTRFTKGLPTLVRQAEHNEGQIGHLVHRLHLQRWVTKNLPKLSTEVGKISKPALSIGAAAASTVVAVVTIAILSFFLLLESSQIWQGFLRLLAPHTARRMVHVAHEVVRSVSGYVLGNALTSIVAGVVVLVTLAALGVPYPLLQALWVALVDLLPLIGGLLAGVPVVVIAFLHSPVAGIVTLVVFVVYQEVENHVLNPLVIGRTVRLRPLWILIAVLVGATLGGRVGSGFGEFIGALLGIPVGGAVQVIWRELRRGPSAELAGTPGVSLGDAGAGGAADLQRSGERGEDPPPDP